MRSRNRHDFEVHGEVYFITSTVVGFTNLFNHLQPCEVFVDCLRYCQERGDFTLLAWVLMPNHFHLVVKRETDKDISIVIGNLKRYTARQIGQFRSVPEMKQTLEQIRSAASEESDKGTAVWKPRFDSLVITTETALRQKIDYIHNNPIRKGFVQEVWQWRYSSAAAYAGKDGIDLPVDTDWRCIGYDRIPSGKDS